MEGVNPVTFEDQFLLGQLLLVDTSLESKDIFHMTALYDSVDISQMEESGHVLTVKAIIIRIPAFLVN